MGAWRRGLLNLGPWRLGRGRLLWWASLSIGVQLENWKGAHVQGSLKDRWRLCRKGSGDGHLLHRDPTWESGRGFIYKGLREIDEGVSRNGAPLSEGALWSEPGGGILLLGIPKDMLSKALEMGTCFHRGLKFWEHRTVFLSKGVLHKGKISYFGKLLWGI